MNASPVEGEMGQGGEPNTGFPPQETSVYRRRRSKSLLRRIQKRIALRVKWRNIAIAVVALVVIALVGGAAVVTSAVSQIQSSLLGVSRVVETLTRSGVVELTLRDYDRLEDGVDDLVGSLTAAQRQLVFLKPFASFNDNADGLLTTLDVSLNLAQAGKDILTGLRPTVFFVVAGEDSGTVSAQFSSGERIIELLEIAQGRFESASVHLATAKAGIDQLDLARLSPDMLVNAQGLIKYHAQLTQIDEMLLKAPDALSLAMGASSQRNYLILSQNSDEIRPSGGYISTYGWMIVRNGRILNYDYSATTATSPNPPPASLVDTLAIPDWWIQYEEPIYAAWDGSWYADFPSTAEMAMWFYNNGNNPRSPVDGVIAIDIVGFEYVLEALGSVVLPEYNQIVTLDNFRDVVYDIRASGEGDTPHKTFLAALYQQIFSDWQSLSGDPQKSTLLLNALLKGLQEKHILLYFVDEDLNTLMRLLGWSGVQSPGVDHDYLMVVDANLGNKSNRSITRQLIYDVDIQADNTVNSRATISYDYSARVARNDPAVNPEYHGAIDYTSLLQVFTPVNSTLSDTSNFFFSPVTVESETHTTFVSLVDVLYDSSERYQFMYSNPSITETFGPYRRYRLELQKQPGSLGDEVIVQVLLPPKARTISVSPEAAATFTLDRPILEFRTILTTDQWIEVVYSIDQ